MEWASAVAERIVGHPETIESQAPSPARGEWLSRYKELAGWMYAVRRGCRRISLLGSSVANPRHPLPAEHLQLSAQLANGNEKAVRNGYGRPPRNADPPPILRLARNWIWVLALALRDTLRLAKLKIRFLAAMRKAKLAPADIVLKTWCFGTESLKSRNDFYYGWLPSLLRERGVQCLLLCGDFAGGDEARFARAALDREHIRSVPERLLLPLWAPMLTVWDQMLTSLALRRLARRSEDPRFASVCSYASMDCLSRFTTQNALYYYIAKAAVKRWRPKVFLTLYEGQPWEKPAWHGAKAGNPDCRIAGYQHTVIMPHSLSVLSPNRNSWEFSTPDLVLCLGETTKTMMEEGHRPHGTKLIRFGSFRRSPGDFILRAPRPDRRTVLVAPEATASEAELLFNFALRVAPSVPDHQFIFRCHPALPFEEIRHCLQLAPEDFPNVELSTRDSIAEDFARSSIVLYRGSSVVVYAVMDGLKPVYLHDAGHYDRDPLFELDGWRESLLSEQEFLEVLRRYRATRQERATQEWRAAAEYTKGYSEAVSAASLDQLLEAAGLSSNGVAP